MPKVAVVRTESRYPTSAPFNPSQNYPEYPFAGMISPESNYVYDGVRQLLYCLGLDRERYGSQDWNPLRFLVEPGMGVVIKPNFVLSRHKQEKDLFSIITHPSVLRAVADYVWIALKGHGKIIFADAPQYDCNWQELLVATRLDQVVSFFDGFSGPEVDLLDLRTYWSRWKHFPSLLEPLPGDPSGSMVVNLGKKSALYEKSHPEKLYGAVYHRNETIAHHSEETQEYELSNTMMKADVVISVPKLKDHKKVGVTLNAKGLVGICTNKNYLVHYSVTPPSHGGDQYPNGLMTPMEAAIIRIERWMYDHLLAPRSRILEYIHRSIYAIHNNTTRRLGIKVDEEKRLLDAGNWYGNDSAWRMTVDLMKCFYFSDTKGRLHDVPQRRTFSIVDGIIGGDNQGPLTPEPVRGGMLLGGDNFLAVDLVATRLMGFDPLKVRVYQNLLSDPDYNFGVHSLDEIQVHSPNQEYVGCLQDKTNRFLDFDPHPGWIGHLEISPKDRVISFPKSV